MTEQGRLAIPFLDGLEIRVAFSGRRACRLARHLSKVLTLPLEDENGFGRSPEIYVASGEDSPIVLDNLLSPNVAPLVAFDAEDGCRLHVPENASCSVAKYYAMLKIAYLLALRKAMQSGLEAMLLHGCLLRLPDSDWSIACFGPGGMGKSTAGRRWCGQGGGCPADDMILVVRKADGQFLARPLPTWSRFPEAVDYRKLFPLCGVFQLLRGQNDEIVPAEASMWRFGLMQELLFHWGGADFLAAREKKAVFQHVLWFTDGLQQQFGCQKIMGALDGRLLENVRRFLGL